MEFKSAFPWQFYLLTAIAQSAGALLYVHNLTLPLIIFIFADLYVLMKIIFKTKYILDGRQLTAKRFLFRDAEIPYSDILEIKPSRIFTAPGFGGVYRIEDSFNFFDIIYTVKSLSSLSGQSRKMFTVHPKDADKFFTELEPHVKNAFIQFELRKESEEKKSKKN